MHFSTPMPATSILESQQQVMNAKAMFQRVLTGWATDVLSLRKRGWDRPCLRLTGTSSVRRTRRGGAARRKAA